MTLGLIITILALGIALFIVLNQCKKAKNKLNTEIENKNSELTRKVDENNKLNSYEFDIIKRITRCRKKGNFEEDLKKTIVVIELYLKEQGNKL
jgi:hypothetical protein